METVTQIAVALLIAAVLFAFREIRDHGTAVAEIKAHESERRISREQGYQRLQIVERLVAEQIPATVDMKLGQVLAKLDDLGDKVNVVDTRLARVETRLENCS